MKRSTLGIGIMVLTIAAIADGCNKTLDTASDTGAQSTQFATLIIPDGTDVVGTLNAPISSGTGHNGDTFALTTLAPIVVDGRTAVPAGARIAGVLCDVQASGRTSGRARMTLAYQEIVDPTGKKYTISAQPLELDAASGTGTDLERIAAGTVLGAVVGGIAGGAEGAAIGAGTGAGVGIVVMIATQSDELELAAGQKMNVHMTSSTSIQVLASN